MSTHNESIQKYTTSNENSKQIIDDQSNSFFDSGCITESCELSGEQSSSGLIADNKLEGATDMTVVTTGNSQSKDNETENYTDSGIVSFSCSTNISSSGIESQSKAAMYVKDLQPYVPEYLIRQRQSQQHPNLQIEKYFEQDEDGYTKLHIAILHHIEPAIQVLVNYAPDASYLNIKNFSGQTALHMAVLMNQSQIVRKLIDAGADINVRDNRCNSPLHLAVLNQDINSLKTLLAAIYPSGNKPLISNLEQWNYEGETPFFAACKLRDVPIMKLLADNGANVNAREGRSGYSALQYAVETHANDVVKFLCENCIDSLDLDSENYGGLTAFQLSLISHQEVLAEYLVKKGASPFFTPESDYDDDDDEIDDDDDENDVSVSDFEELEKNQLVNKIAEIAVN